MQRFNLRSRSTSLAGENMAQENARPGKALAEAAAEPKRRTRAALADANKNIAQPPQGLNALVKKTGYGAQGQSRLSRPPIRKENSSTVLGAKVLRSGVGAEAKPELPVETVKAEAVEDVEMHSPKSVASPAPIAEITEDQGGSCESAGVRSYSSTMIKDIDEGDASDPQMVAPFAVDIYNYLRHRELHFRIAPQFLGHHTVGRPVTGRMRGILVDWLHQVQTRFQLLPETMYLTVLLTDRYLEKVSVVKEELQLVGVTGMLIASKFEEVFAPEINDFIYITDNTYTKKQIIKMELKMLGALGIELGQPLPIHFLRRYSKAAEADSYVHTLAKYIMELATCEYTLAAVLPSHLAGAALLLSSFVLRSEGAEEAPAPEALWTPTLQHYSALSLAPLKPIARKLAKLLLKVSSEKSKFKGVRSKYGLISAHEALTNDVLNTFVDITQ